MHLTENEEEFLNLLVEIGTRRSVATVLVFLVHVPSATSRAIRCCTDLGQSEISAAIRYLQKEGWIESRESKTKIKGRPVRIYMLAKPIAAIMDSIEKETMKAADDQLQLIQKLRDDMS